MSSGILHLARNLMTMAVSGHASRRGVAAAFKLAGRRLERRWPYFPRASGDALNFGFDDLLEFQRARTQEFSALIVGAYDGVANDPASDFIRSHNCRAVFVEPQPAPFERLRKSMQGATRVALINAAVDEHSGSRMFYTVSAGHGALPAWTEQLGSFDRNHLLKHEDKAPGLSAHIVSLNVPTLTFSEILRNCELTKLDLLQIDAEGMDAKLLGWFPFELLKPSLVYFENAHMSPDEHAGARRRLQGLGYTFCEPRASLDDMAVLL